MLVKSAFTGFLNNRLAAGARMTIMMGAIFFIASSFTDHSDPHLRAKQMNLKIRQIGHRLLLQTGDSTSRVLPVTEDRKGTFKLSFENKFVFNHDSLMVLSKSLLPKTQFASGYIVTVHDCITGGMVYGFQLNNSSPDMLACKGRSQPAGCYTIEFTFPDFYETVKQEKAQIDQGTQELKSDKIDSRELNLKPVALETTNSGYANDPKIEDLKSVKADQQAGDSRPGEFKAIIFGYPLINVVFGGMLLLLGVTLLIRRFGKISKPELLQIQDHATIQDDTILEDYEILIEPVPDLPLLGKFLFNVKDQHLLLGSEVISLTDKECKVLELLHKNFGELIPRETLLQEVWIKEGVITGRSLDMFVSKLRKKLSLDPELKITNVHGKGYKLEITVEQIA